MAVESTDQDQRTHYDVLGLPNLHVSFPEIKVAYHRALLAVHPDKVLGATGAEGDVVREAWKVLSDEKLRKEYDAKLQGISKTTMPTPGGSVVKKAFVNVDLDDMKHVDGHGYTFPCRCGESGGFAVTEADLEKGRDVVECRGCSSWIRVSYELLPDE